MEKVVKRVKRFFKKVAIALGVIKETVVDILREWGYRLVAFIRDNPVEAVSIGGAAVAGGRKLLLAYREHCETDRRLRDFYDPRTGKHVWARRKLSVREQVEVDARHSAGESYTKILFDMGLLASR